MSSVGELVEREREGTYRQADGTLCYSMEKEHTALAEAPCIGLTDPFVSQLACSLDRTKVWSARVRVQYTPIAVLKVGYAGHSRKERRP